jgi:hypothetical protein
MSVGYASESRRARRAQLIHGVRVSDVGEARHLPALY